MCRTSKMNSLTQKKSAVSIKSTTFKKDCYYLKWLTNGKASSTHLILNG